MGTSASSTGPKGGVSLDPPWLNDIALPAPGAFPPPGGQEEDGTNPQDAVTDQPPQPLQVPIQFAPPRRYSNARRKLRDFATTGNVESFRKAVGHYSRTGMGGAHRVASRMRTSTKTGASLYGFLQSVSAGTDPAINEWVRSLAGRNAGAQEVIDVIIQRVAPGGGSLDETACRESMAQALEDLLELNPTIDLLHLNDGDIWAIIESFLGYEAFSRLCLDIGQIFENSALSPRDRVTRMNEMQEYLKAELSAQIEILRTQTPGISSNQLQAVLHIAVQNTFLVYEGAL